MCSKHTVMYLMSIGESQRNIPFLHTISTKDGSNHKAYMLLKLFASIDSVSYFCILDPWKARKTSETSKVSHLWAMQDRHLRPSKCFSTYIGEFVKLFFPFSVRMYFLSKGFRREFQPDNYFLFSFGSWVKFFSGQQKWWNARGCFHGRVSELHMYVMSISELQRNSL